MNDKNIVDMADSVLGILIKIVIYLFVLWVICGGYLHECGMCGARTFETWYAGPDCPVCSKCYDELRYND